MSDITAGQTLALHTTRPGFALWLMIPCDHQALILSAEAGVGVELYWVFKTSQNYFEYYYM